MRLNPSIISFLSIKSVNPVMIDIVIDSININNLAYNPNLNLILGKIFEKRKRKTTNISAKIKFNLPRIRTTFPEVKL